MNLLALLFLRPIVQEIDRVNVFFQATQADPQTMTRELDILHKSIKSRIKDSHGNLLAISQANFGCTFASNAERMRRESVNEGREAQFQDNLGNLKNFFMTFLQTLLCQVEKRLPPLQATFHSLSGLHPSKVLSQAAQVPFDQLPSPHLMADCDLVEVQYRKMLFHPWLDEEVFSGGIPTETALFWSKVLLFVFVFHFF